jgi:lambda family phage portal protein
MKVLRQLFGLVRRPQIASATVRRFEGAGGGRRFAGLLQFGNSTTATLAANPTLRGRQRTMVANNAWLASGVASHVAAAVGCGIKPQSLHPGPEMRARLHRMWNTWVDRADIEGRADFYGLTAAVVRAMIVDGETFVRLETVGRNLRLRHIPAEQVDSAYTLAVPGGGRIIGGVEFDASGVRVAYHVFRDPLGDPFPQAFALERVRVPAADMLHLFDPLWPGQVRGTSPLATILLRLHELDQLEDAQLVRIKLGAMLAGFIKKDDGSGAGFQGKQDSSVLEAGLEPGTLKVLPEGADVTFSEPVEPGNVTEWIKLQLHALAAGIGVTYEQLTGDLSGVNYSSIRAGLVEFRRRIEALQHNVIVFQFCRPVWRRLVQLAMLRGELPDDGNPETFEASCAVNWIPPGWDWVDPEKDARADAQAIAAGLKSRREVVAARGYDVEQLDAEIAADRAREKRLGLDFGPPSVPPQKPVEVQPNA